MGVYTASTGRSRNVCYATTPYIPSCAQGQMPPPRSVGVERRGDDFRRSFCPSDLQLLPPLVSGGPRLATWHEDHDNWHMLPLAVCSASSSCVQRLHGEKCPTAYLCLP